MSVLWNKFGSFFITISAAACAPFVAGGKLMAGGSPIMICKVGFVSVEYFHDLYETTCCANKISKICGDMDLGGKGAKAKEIGETLQKLSKMNDTGECNHALKTLNEIVADCRKFTPSSKNSGSIGFQRLADLCWVGWAAKGFTGQGDLYKYCSKVGDFEQQVKTCELKAREQSSKSCGVTKENPSIRGQCSNYNGIEGLGNRQCSPNGR